MVCGSCSSHKAALQYDKDRVHRVCDACHIILSRFGGDAADDKDDDDIYGVIDRLRADRTKTKSILKVNGLLVNYPALAEAWDGG